MNIAWFLGLLIFVTTEASMPEKIAEKAQIEQRVLLRKLQKRSAPRGDVKSVTWNEILADVLVNKIKIFPFNRIVEPVDVAKEPKENLLTECVGQILAIYKSLYDKYKTGSNVDTLKFVPLVVTENPKEEFEVIQPIVNAESCDDCVVEKIDKFGDKVCPKGQEMNAEGVCEDRKPNKLILAIPKQCPIGYRADRLGYCRKSF